MDIKKIVEGYIKLRDKKAVLKKQYEEEVKNIDLLLTKAEGALLKHFDATGAESVKTAAGTAYKSSRTSATVADWDIFWGFVQKNEAWEFLEHRANKKAVEDFKKENDDLPPGINWRSETVVNVRRGD